MVSIGDGESKYLFAGGEAGVDSVGRVELVEHARNWCVKVLCGSHTHPHCTLDVLAGLAVVPQTKNGY